MSFYHHYNTNDNFNNNTSKNLLELTKITDINNNQTKHQLR